jgi:hypothetical protein
MRLTKKCKTIIAGAAIIGLASSGVAYAYWTTSGNGVGSATTGTSTAVTLLQVGTISAMTPGSAAQALDFSINNPVATNQFITSVVIAITGVTGPNIDGTHPCVATDYTLVQPTVTYGDLTPGVHTYSPSGSTLHLVNNPVANQDGCKGATVALSFTAS